MKISARQYASVLYDLVSGLSREEAVPVIDKFASFLVSSNQSHLAGRIAKEFSAIWNKGNLVAEAEVTSAFELDAGLSSLVEGYIKKNSGAAAIEMEKRLDKGLLGGVVIKYGDRIYDASLKAQLAKLRNELLNA